MSKYSVHLYQTVLEEAWVEVEADDETAAGDAAVELAMVGNAQWSFLESCDSPIEVVDVTAAPETPDYLRPLLDEEDES